MHMAEVGTCNPSRSEQVIGLIAGNGKFPYLLAKEAKAKGFKVIAFAFRGETDPVLSKSVDAIHWLGLSELGGLFRALKREGIKKAAMAGQIRPSLLFSNLKMDKELQGLLSQTRDKRADTLLGAVAERLKNEDIELINSVGFLSALLPERGALTETEPSKEEWKDIDFAKLLAKELGRLDIGQTVVVKKGAVLAIEAIEGTDKAIRRGSKLGGSGVVVVKMSKPQQDLRFDVPVVGRRTVEILVETKARVLAIEAEKTLLIDEAECKQIADTHRVCIVAV